MPFDDDASGRGLGACSGGTCRLTMVDMCLVSRRAYSMTLKPSRSRVNETDI